MDAGKIIDIFCLVIGLLNLIYAISTKKIGFWEGLCIAFTGWFMAKTLGFK
jgi:hypothetical protein